MVTTPPILSIGTDVRERIALEESLRQAQEDHRDRLAMLSHELRAPLAAIRNARAVMEIALAKGEFALITDMLQRTDLSIERLASLVEGLTAEDRLAELAERQPEHLLSGRRRHPLSGYPAHAKERAASMSPIPHLALIEEDPEQRESLLLWLQLKEYRVWGAESAEAFYRKLQQSRADIVIIDLGLSGENGLQTIHHLRTKGRLGIIIVSARSSTKERLQGIKQGADLYLVKPVEPAELALYIDSLWQRMNEASLTPSDGVWILERKLRQLQTPHGATLSLTPSELVIIDVLAGSAAPLPRSELVVHLGGDLRTFAMHRIDAHLHRIRSKLKQVSEESLPMRTLPGARLEWTAAIERK